MFCPFCPLTNCNIATGKKELCHKWCRQFDRKVEEGWVCHHIDMVTDEYVEKCKTEMEAMETMYLFVKEIEVIRPQCKLDNSVDPSAANAGPQNMNDARSINFDYINCNFSQKVEFMNNVRNNLLVRSITTDGTSVELVNRL